MTDLHQKKEIKSANTMSPLVAGIAGAIAGGAAVAAAVVMSDKKNQKKVKDAWLGAKEKVEKGVSDTKKKIEGKT